MLYRLDKKAGTVCWAGYKNPSTDGQETISFSDASVNRFKEDPSNFVFCFANTVEEAKEFLLPCK